MLYVPSSAACDTQLIRNSSYCSQEQFLAWLLLRRSGVTRRAKVAVGKTARVAVPGLDQRTNESETAAGTASDTRVIIAGGGAALPLHRPFGGAAAAGGAAGRPRRPSMASYFACW